MRTKEIGSPAKSISLKFGTSEDVRFVGFHPVSSELLLVESLSGSLSIVSLLSGEVLASRSRTSLLGESPGLSISSSMAQDSLVRATNNSKIPILNISDLSVRFEITAQHGVTAISTQFSPCGEYLAIGYGRYVLGTPDRPVDSVVEIWKLTGNRELAAWQRMPGIACSTLAWSGDSSFLAVFSGDMNQSRGFLALIDSADWKIRQICETKLGMFQSAFVGRASILLLGAQGCELRPAHDIGDIEELAVLEVKELQGTNAFGPGGYIFIAGSLVCFEDQKTLILPERTVWASSLQDGGVVSLHKDGALYIWPAASLEV